jgi:hypothetical protein
MPTAQGLSAPQDSNGQSYPAIRPGTVTQLNLVAGTSVTTLLQAATKVVRICGVTDVNVRIGIAPGPATAANDLMVAAAHYQDFVVKPGESVSMLSVAGGYASLVELA